MDFVLFEQSKHILWNKYCFMKAQEWPIVMIVVWDLERFYKLRSIAKQVIPTYINHSRPLIPDGIHLLFWTRFERREKPDMSLYAER